MRTVVACVVVALVVARPTRADDAPRTPDRAAAEAITAHDAKDADALRRVAAGDDPDPWIVADALLGLGRRDAAEAFARAAPRKDVERLPAFVAAWTAGADDAAARDALARGNAALLAERFDEAREAFTRAPEGAMPYLRVRAEFGRGLALRRAGRLPEAAERLAAAAATAESLGWLQRAASAWWESARAAGTDGSYAPSLAPLKRFVAVQERRGDAAAHARALDGLGLLHGDLRAWADAAAAHREAVEVAGDALDRAWVAETLVHLANAEGRAGRLREARDAADRALTLAGEAGLPALAARAHEIRGMAHTMDGRPDLAEAAYAEALARARESGDAALVARMVHLVGVCRAERDEHEAAIAPLREALDAFDALDAGRGPRGTIARAYYARSLAAAGRLDEAQPHVERALREAGEATRFAQGIGRWAEGALLVGRGKTDEALVALRAAAQHLEAARELDASLVVAAQVADLLRVAGRATEARAAADTALAVSRRVKNPLSLPHLLAVSARLDLAEGRRAEALAQAREALAAFESRGLTKGADAMRALVGEIERAADR